MRRILFAFVLLQIVGCSSTNNLYQSSVQFEEHGEISLSYEEAENGLCMTLETSDPVALRTLLMQGLTLFIQQGMNDTIMVTFPSAKDVSNDMEHHPGEVKATLSDDKEKRPDIRPLVAALNKAEVFICCNDSIEFAHFHKIEINASMGNLAYQVIVPYHFMKPDNLGFTVTLLSKPDTAMLQKGEFSSEKFTSRSSENRPQPFGVGQQQTDKSPQRVIRINFTFDKDG